MTHDILPSSALPNSTRPTILVAYPSDFYYVSGLDRVEIKTSQLLVASYLAQFYPVTYADFEISIGRPNTPVQIRRFERRVRDYFVAHPADILALSCWASISYMATLTVARIFRELYPDKLIIVGGYHPTARPEEFQTPENIIDYVVRGEGELAVADIAEAFPGRGRPSRTTVVEAPTFPAERFCAYNWDLVEPFVRAEFPKGLTNLYVYLSRGCPFDCSFCMESLKDRKWRAYPPDRAIDLLVEATRRFHPRGVAIADACFGMRPTWRREFLRLLAEIKPEYWLVFETRPEYLEEADIRILADLKVEVQLGIESCSPQILTLMKKTRHPVKFLEQFEHVSELMSTYGVLHRANLIFNHPGETEQTLEQTFAFMDRSFTRGDSCLIWGWHEYMHFPGCEIDRNSRYYEETFGSRFNCPQWWREESDQYEGSVNNVPSHDLSNGRTRLWERLAAERDGKFRASLSQKALKFAAEKYYPEWLDDSRYQQV
jgi:radical SAM superfamily enzyme YgiQ (UPF0313 family)